MDPLSISVAILGILTVTEKVIKWGLDAEEAPREIKALKGRFESLHTVLTRLYERCRKAEVQGGQAPWLRGLWEIRRDRVNDEGKRVVEHGGVLADLINTIQEMATKVNPSRNWEKPEAIRRVLWKWKKESIKELDATLTQCFTVINTILNLNNDETTNETLDLTKQLSSRMSMFEAHQIREEQRRIQEREEEEKEKIIDWLSPLSFLAKQDEIW